LGEIGPECAKFRHRHRRLALSRYGCSGPSASGVHGGDPHLDLKIRIDDFFAGAQVLGATGVALNEIHELAIQIAIVKLMAPVKASR
jgi:hypothetical protein